MLPKKREPCKLLKGIIIRSAIMENSMKFPQKTKYKTAFDPAILLLGIYPKEMKAEYWRNTCTLVFTTALFTIAKLWKQPKCLSTDKWEN